MRSLVAHAVRNSNDSAPSAAETRQQIGSRDKYSNYGLLRSGVCVSLRLHSRIQHVGDRTDWL